jgi:hypothetical protein
MVPAPAQQWAALSILYTGLALLKELLTTLVINVL